MSTILTPVTQLPATVSLTDLALPAVVVLLVLLVLRSLMTGARARRANEMLLIAGFPLGLVFIITVTLKLIATLAR